MRLRRRKTVAAVAPEGAHGQRNIDGSYFSVWVCGNGHASIGNVDDAGSDVCSACHWASVMAVITSGGDPPASEPTSEWRRCDQAEAHRHIIDLEGFSGAYSGIGFTLL